MAAHPTASQRRTATQGRRRSGRDGASLSDGSTPIAPREAVTPPARGTRKRRTRDRPARASAGARGRHYGDAANRRAASRLGRCSAPRRGSRMPAARGCDRGGGPNALHVLIDLGHALRESFFMLWETLWALVLGFTLAGAVQAFVSRAPGAALLGGHDPRRMARAALLRGGLVLLLLRRRRHGQGPVRAWRGLHRVDGLHGRFDQPRRRARASCSGCSSAGSSPLAEFVGGAIMIALGSCCLPRVLAAIGGSTPRPRGLARRPSRRPRLDRSERRRPAERPRAALAGGRTPPATRSPTSRCCAGVVGRLPRGRLPRRGSSRSSSGASLFLTGHGFWTTLENAVGRPARGGRELRLLDRQHPLAAALWHGGSASAASSAFVFADLITLPLLLDLPPILRRSPHAAAVRCTSGR